MPVFLENQAGELHVWEVESPEMASRVQHALKWLPPQTILGDPHRIEALDTKTALKIAGYFKADDLILYGKYKNKKGRILRIFVDEKGHPAIEVEPVPKGRKQNKIIGLYKIWKAPKEMHDKFIAAKVAGRFLYATGLPLGKTIETGDLRIHRFRDMFKIWDLTHAGKRGKKVRLLVVGPSSSYPNPPERWMDGMSKALPSYRDYRAVVNFIEDLLVDFPGEIDMDEYQERGVDVTPKGFKPIKLKAQHIYIEADYEDFRVTSLDDPNESTCIPAIKGGKRSIPVFYRWVQDNMSAIQRMTFPEVVEQMRKLGIKYHQYCAMD